nr:SOSS complex subunit B homolog [Tanacetum cinerariifolium]
MMCTYNAYKKTKRREGVRNCGLDGVLKGEDGESSKDFRPEITAWRDEIMKLTKCDIFQPGYILRLINGMFTYNHDKYFVLRAGRRGKLQKVGEFTMAFEESPNMSEIVRVPDPDNPKKYIQKSVISRPWFSIPFYLNYHLTCSTHLIQGDGTFNTGGFDSFMKRVIMAECALSDGVLAIMGPQNSACDGSFFPSQMKLSGVVVQGQWFTGCDSGITVQRASWVYPTSTTGNETLTVRSSLISWKDIGMEGFVSRGAS